MGRKKKTYNPWENLIEKHPWIRFPLTDNNATHLIIGSFPPNKFTTHKEDLDRHDTDFFYGSKDNEFWELFINSFGLNYKWPDDIDNLKKWLSDNKWIVTDIVLKAKRKANTAFDTDLIEIEWNIDTIDAILKNNPIDFIYFTSQWVKNKYKTNIEDRLSTKKKINDTVLVSPSRNGLRSLKRTKFLKIKMKLNESPTDFRIRYYKETLNIK